MTDGKYRAGSVVPRSRTGEGSQISWCVDVAASRSYGINLLPDSGWYEDDPISIVLHQCGGKAPQVTAASSQKRLQGAVQLGPADGKQILRLAANLWNDPGWISRSWWQPVKQLLD